jgi:hypothetical protein
MDVRKVEVVIRSRKSQDRQYKAYTKTKKKPMIYKTLHINSTIEQQDSHKKLWGKLGCSGRVCVLPFSYHQAAPLH